MGLLDGLKGLFGGTAETCPSCGATLVDDGDGMRFECHSCPAGPFFMEGGVLVDAWDPQRRRGNAKACLACGGSLANAERTEAWEDGDNAATFDTCPSCGFENPL